MSPFKFRFKETNNVKGKKSANWTCIFYIYCAITVIFVYFYECDVKLKRKEHSNDIAYVFSTYYFDKAYLLTLR